jgi:hypothetical protein
MFAAEHAPFFTFLYNLQTKQDILASLVPLEWMINTSIIYSLATSLTSNNPSIVSFHISAASALIALRS